MIPNNTAFASYYSREWLIILAHADSPPMVLHGSQDDLLEVKSNEIHTVKPYCVTSLTFLNQIPPTSAEGTQTNSTATTTTTKFSSESNLLDTEQNEGIGLQQGAWVAMPAEQVYNMPCGSYSGGSGMSDDHFTSDTVITNSKLSL